VPPMPTFSPPEVQPPGRPVEISGACASPTPLPICKVHARAALVIEETGVRAPRPAPARVLLIMEMKLDSSPGFGPDGCASAAAGLIVMNDASRAINMAMAMRCLGSRGTSVLRLSGAALVVLLYAGPRLNGRTQDPASGADRSRLRCWGDLRCRRPRRREDPRGWVERLQPATSGVWSAEHCA